MVKVICQKAALSPLYSAHPNTDGSIVFSGMRQCAPPCNTCFLGPTPVHNPNGISICSATFAQLTAECPRACLGIFFRLKLSFHTWGSSGPHLIHGSMGPPSPQLKRHLNLFSHLHTSRQSVVGDVGACPSFSTLLLSMSGSETPSNTWFLGSTRLSIPSGISVGSATYAQPTADCQYTLQWSLPKNCPFPWGIWTHLIHCSYWAGPT